jgi:tripartite-type tricarboxylate transporter receptor subunit TctC
MAMELFKLATGIEVTHIPYKTTSTLMPDLISGQISLMFLSLQVALPLAANNKINILCAGGNQRAAGTPNLPSLAEAAGIQNINVDTWYAMYAPAGTPDAIVAKLNTELNALLKEPEIRSGMAKIGLVVTGGTPQELARMTKSDLERWSKVVQEAGIRAD